MITLTTHVFLDLINLDLAVRSGAIADSARAAHSIFVQVYCAETDPAFIRSITSCIAQHLPKAVVIGATTAGEIAQGRLLTGETVIGFTFFESSSITAIALPCDDGNEQTVGAELGRQITQITEKVAGILLLCTPLSINAATLLQGVESTAKGYLMFGGGAGDYASLTQSLVFNGATIYSKGVVAVVLTGDKLFIESKTYLGWKPLSKPMRVTEVEGLWVKSVDNKPAFELYERYLSIPNDQDFFLNALEFPFLMERDGELLARVPIAAREDGALQFAADVREGETFRIGYGDPDLIVSDARQIHQSMRRFSPQAVFLYTCSCRRFLMQEDVDLETLPFEAIAPTFGFYTYGEFFGSDRLCLLNSTMVSVGLREESGQASTNADKAEAVPETPAARDPLANKHARVVTRLMRFIGAVSSELEAANQEVTQLSITDSLTQSANRMRLDQILDQNLQLALRYGTPFSIILIDIDHFKQVNDTHGHIVGDEVLVKMAKVLAANTRSIDLVGRWGGEEFLVVAPSTGLDQAAQLAEKLRDAIDNADFPVVGHKTCSFGVAGYTPGSDLIKLIGRADTALYAAKHAGRNRVVIDRTA
jgi:diguanylate cyclase (GGDEF)-like protein